LGFWFDKGEAEREESTHDDGRVANVRRGDEVRVVVGDGVEDLGKELRSEHVDKTDGNHLTDLDRVAHSGPFRLCPECD
jgi:hypothetical protein